MVHLALLQHPVGFHEMRPQILAYEHHPRKGWRLLSIPDIIKGVKKTHFVANGGKRGLKASSH